MWSCHGSSTIWVSITRLWIGRLFCRVRWSLLLLAQQQGRTVQGVVLDSNQEPVIGANVLVKGTTIGTITDIDGRFTLEVPDNAVLVVSYIGYLSTELVLRDRRRI